MKIAVVDQKVNKGGLSRVIKKLLPEISKSNSISITYDHTGNQVLRCYNRPRN